MLLIFVNNCNNRCILIIFFNQHIIALYIILIFKIFINGHYMVWLSAKNLLITQNDSIYTFLHFSKKSLAEYNIFSLIIYFNFVIFLIDFGLSSFEYRVERKLLSLINTFSFWIFGIDRYLNLFLGMGNKSNEHNTHHVVKFDHLK